MNIDRQNTLLGGGGGGGDTGKRILPMKNSGGKLLVSMCLSVFDTKAK